MYHRYLRRYIPSRSRPHPLLRRHCGLSVEFLTRRRYSRCSDLPRLYLLPLRFCPPFSVSRFRFASHSPIPVPVPCPYKSSQSLAFRKLATFSRWFFNTTHESVILILYLFTVQLPAFLCRILNKEPSGSTGTWRYCLFPDRAYLFWAHNSWIDFDRTCVRLTTDLGLDYSLR